ncbi:class I SAM-dependent methyltransferase [Legionella septentrionalis]|uniref:class I SAM-dependent methyltransferase n=1 Tax=Legionella septentrionalis TaxID=2498109 RepID=UPI0013153FB2|nr:class I SAM-dependent methyltransferase [Legionella septentrionalis]
MLNDYTKFINFYIEDITGTGYLAFRDLPFLININSGSKALDFGCGAGRSSKYLKRLGFNITGVDINAEIIARAKLTLPTSEFLVIDKYYLPFENAEFDLVFNSFVLFDMPTKIDIFSNLMEMKRVCKPGGNIITIVNSDYLFTKKWLTVENNFSQNLNLKSGDVARLFLLDIKVDIYDYFWSSEDYKECFEKVGFKKICLHEPLGNINDGYPWKDEFLFPPYSIYICEC